MQPPKDLDRSRLGRGDLELAPSKPTNDGIGDRVRYAEKRNKTRLHVVRLGAFGGRVFELAFDPLHDVEAHGAGAYSLETCRGEITLLVSFVRLEGSNP